MKYNNTSSNKKSIVQELDPRTKLCLLLISIILVIKTENWRLLIVTMGIITLINLSKISFKFLWDVLFRFKWLIMMILLLNIFFSVSDIILSNKIIIAGLRTFKIYLLLVIAFWFNIITTSFELINAIDYMLKPLEKFKLQLYDITMIFILVVRFLPEIMDIADNIIIAQHVRGVKPKKNWKNSTSWIKSSIIPIFIVGIRKTLQTSLVLEAKGYRPGAPRTGIKVLKFTKIDYAILFLAIATLLLFFKLRI